MTRAGESNAREHGRPSYLAKKEPCRYCSAPIVLAICRDGRWRTFNPDPQPPAPAGVWAWRKRWGMEEQEIVPGHRLHFCAEYARVWSGFDLSGIRPDPSTSAAEVTA